MGVNPNQGMFLAAVLSNIGKGHAVPPPPPLKKKKKKKGFFLILKNAQM